MAEHTSLYVLNDRHIYEQFVGLSQYHYTNSIYFNNRYTGDHEWMRKWRKRNSRGSGGFYISLHSKVWPNAQMYLKKSFHRTLVNAEKIKTEETLIIFEYQWVCMTKSIVNSDRKKTEDKVKKRLTKRKKNIQVRQKASIIICLAMFK